MLFGTKAAVSSLSCVDDEMCETDNDNNRSALDGAGVVVFAIFASINTYFWSTLREDTDPFRFLTIWITNT